MSEKQAEQSLIVWLPNGNSMKFENVRGFELQYSPEIQLTFYYHDVSGAVDRYAVFNDAKLLGWALEEV